MNRLKIVWVNKWLNAHQNDKMDNKWNESIFCLCDKNNHTVEQTHFHTGEITTVSPSKPATGGALVNVHLLQVHIHTNNTPARKEKKGGEEGE